MTPIERFLTELVDAFVGPAAHDVPGLAMRIDAVTLDLPVEARIGSGAAVHMSLPRGQLATGFDWPRSRISVQLAGTSSENTEGGA